MVTAPDEVRRGAYPRTFSSHATKHGKKSICESNSTIAVVEVVCDYRGVSTFDVMPDLGKSFVHFRIPGGTAISEALAVTKDAFNRRFGGYHYTVAPKDDMPLSLFLVWLGAIEASLKAEGGN